MYPLKLIPFNKAYRWGGVKLNTQYNKTFNGENIAECWEVSCHRDGLSVVANGKHKGECLSDVLKANPSWVSANYNAEEQFPLLIKLIDAKDNLSIQVHPCDDYARKFNSLGKSECWYIVSAEEDAGIYLGLKDSISKEQLNDSLTKGTLLERLNFISVKSSDIFYVPCGLIHAIGKGVVVYELQQSSNLTYRLYDYNWTDTLGNPRQLHIEDGCNVASLKKYEILGDYSAKNGIIVDSKYFTLSSFTNNCDVDTTASFCALTVIEGRYTINFDSEQVDINCGESIFIPCGLSVEVKGNGRILSAKL